MTYRLRTAIRGGELAGTGGIIVGCGLKACQADQAVRLRTLASLARRAWPSYSPRTAPRCRSSFVADLLAERRICFFGRIAREIAWILDFNWAWRYRAAALQISHAFTIVYRNGVPRFRLCARTSWKENMGWWAVRNTVVYGETREAENADPERAMLARARPQFAPSPAPPCLASTAIR